MPRCPLMTPKMAILQGFPRALPSTSRSSSGRCARRSADPAPIRGRWRRRGGAAHRPRGGRTAVAGLRRSLAPPPSRSPRRPRDTRQGRSSQAHALVRRAARLRPALVQRRRASADRRPSGAGRSSPGRARGDRARRNENRRLPPAGAVRVRRRRDLHGPARRRAPARGHEADLVSVPFKWYPGTRVLTQAFLWRMLDLEEADGKRIDLVVATKFPSYLVRHPEKRVWLVHQFRQAYELDGTDLGQFGDSAEERAIRRKVQALDRVALGEASRLFAISQNVAGRLEASTGLQRRGAPASAAGARVPLRELRRLRPLGQPPRPREADRPPARGGGARRFARGRHRRRRARSRAARAARSRSRPQRPRPLHRPHPGRRARRSLRALSRRLLRAGRRGLRHGPARGVPLREARADDDGRRRPARDRRPTGPPGSS